MSPLLLLAAFALAQEGTTRRPEPRNESRAELPVPRQAPAAPLAAGGIGFGPMIDRDELRRFALGSRPDSFAHEDPEAKRGFKRLKLDKEREAAPGAPLTPAEAVIHNILLTQMGKPHVQEDGSVMTLVGYEAGKADPFKWKIEHPDGRTDHFWCPLVFDLDGDGVRMSRRAAKFDITGDQQADQMSDISSGDGMLVFDGDKDGVSGENGREVFGNAADLDGDRKPDGYKDGFGALNALARKAGLDLDGVLDAGELAALGKSHGLRIKKGGVLGKLMTLEKAGISSIVLTRTKSETFENFDGQGNKVTRRQDAEFVRKDGSKGSYEDVWFGL